MGEWILTCTDIVCPPWRTSRTKRIYDDSSPNHKFNMVMVFVALAMNISGNDDVASMIGKGERQGVGARITLREWRVLTLISYACPTHARY